MKPVPSAMPAAVTAAGETAWLDSTSCPKDLVARMGV